MKLITVIITCFSSLKKWFITCGLFLFLFAPFLLSGEEKTEYVIYIMRVGKGYEKRIVYDLADMFQLQYSCGQPRYLIYLFQSGNFIKGKENTDIMYYVESYSRLLTKNKVVIKLIPYNYPDPRHWHAQ